MWCNHSFSQRSNITERAMGRWGLQVAGKWGGGGGWTKFGKGGIRGGLHKIGGLGPLCQLCYCMLGMVQLCYHNDWLYSVTTRYLSFVMIKMSWLYCTAFNGKNVWTQNMIKTKNSFWLRFVMILTDKYHS